MQNFEKDLRLSVLNSLLTSPQGQVAETALLHGECRQLDPIFYAHMAVWYQKEGSVRDHAELFVANLLISEFPSHREAGAALLQEFPPFQVQRVVQHLKRCYQKTPRLLRTAVTEYLREREGRNEFFDRAALRASKALKGLYASLHIKPSPRAEAILFDNQPPSDSLAFAVKRLAKAQSETEQVELILGSKLPFPVAIGAVRQVTPALVVSLLHNMSSAELLQNLASLKTRGVLEHPEIRQLVELKLQKAKGDHKVSAFKADKALQVAAGDLELQAQLEAVTDQRVKAKGRIRRSTALLVDKSSSLQCSIDLGKKLAAMLSGVMDAPLYVYAFDSLAFRITAESQGPVASVADWERAFLPIKANGCTSCGVAIASMRTLRQIVEQIVIVTDEEENTAPYFVNELGEYARQFGFTPDVTIVGVGRVSNYLQNQMRIKRLGFQTYHFSGDWNSLPNLIPLLSRPGQLDLLRDILATNLPRRKSKLLAASA